jgi:SAM-dependent methyltransferase
MGQLMTAPSLQEQDPPALYSTYYPRKCVDTKDLVQPAASADTTGARARRWWVGIDNQGQYLVRSGEKMLDVGRGSGLSLLEANALGAQAYGVEADPNVQRIATKLGLHIHIGSLHDSPFPDVRFDLIVLNQVIEHIPEPDAALIRLKATLKPGGRIVLVFPNRRSVWCRLFGRKWINWHIPYHLHHFDATGFTSMADRWGYQMVRRRTITPNIWTILQLLVVRHKALPGHPSPIWWVQPKQQSAQGGATLSSTDKPPRWYAAGQVAKACCFAALSVANRILDAAGLGDSLLVQLKPREGA